MLLQPEFLLHAFMPIWADSITNTSISSSKVELRSDFCQVISSGRVGDESCTHILEKNIISIREARK